MGEIPYRRYSPRAFKGKIRLDSEADSNSLDGRREVIIHCDLIYITDYAF